MTLKHNRRLITQLHILILILVASVLWLAPETVSAATSGSCGDKVSWELSAGHLSITGKGTMTDYTDAQMAPWYDKAGEILSVSVEEGVTTIGKLAFYHCENLERVELPQSIYKIGKLAFTGCTKLSNIYLGSDVSIIEDHAFEGCESLKAMELPVGLTEIGYHAFYRCASLRSMRIPYTVFSIGNGAFAYCEDLMQVTMEGAMEELPPWIFYGCPSLVRVSLPKTITSVETFAFKGCTSLKTIYHSGSAAERDSLKQQILVDLPTLTDVVDTPSGDVIGSEWSGSETKPDGSTVDTSKDVVDTDNSTIGSTSQVTKPSTGGKENLDIDIDITIKNDDGWQEAIDKIDEATKYPDRLGDDDTTVGNININIQAPEKPSLDGDDLNGWTGSDINVSITTPSGDNWTIRGDDLTGDYSGKYDLGFNVSDNKKPSKDQAEILGDKDSYLLDFDDELPFKFTVNVPLPSNHAGDYATLYQKTFLGKWKMVQTVLVDRDGKASFHLDGTDDKTKFMIGINVDGVDTSDAIVPESMYEEYGGLVDENGVRYEVTGTKSTFGMTFTQVTLILGAVVLVSIIVVGLIVRMAMKQKKYKR